MLRRKGKGVLVCMLNASLSCSKLSTWCQWLLHEKTENKENLSQINCLKCLCTHKHTHKHTPRAIRETLCSSMSGLTKSSWFCCESSFKVAFLTIKTKLKILTQPSTNFHIQENPFDFNSVAMGKLISISFNKKLSFKCLPGNLPKNFKLVKKLNNLLYCYTKEQSNDFFFYFFVARNSIQTSTTLSNRLFIFSTKWK